MAAQCFEEYESKQFQESVFRHWACLKLRNFWIFSTVRKSKYWVCFRPQVKGRGTLERANPITSSLHLRISFWNVVLSSDRLCCLVVWVPGYRSRGHGFDSMRYQIFWEVVGLEWGPLSIVCKTKELLGRQSSSFGLRNKNTAVGIRCADHATPSIPKSWHWHRRQAAASRSV
jgi:hypothetical protein